MSCEDFEMNIYIYSELSIEEKKLLDIHLQSCANCAALFREVQQANYLISQVAEEKIVPPNAARLTSGIMSKIASRGESQRFSFVDLLIGRARLAMTVLSLVMLIGFAIEFLNDSTQSKILAGESANSSIIVSAKLFRENFLHKSAKPPYADCRTPFKSSQYYLNCVKSKLK
jgi:hypothetical protein